MQLRLKTSRTRFAILARVSTRDQLSGHSIKLQKDEGQRYVSKCGGVVAKIYEAQESATTENREVLAEVLRDAGKVFSDLVVQDPSRLSRNPAVMFSAMTRLAEADVRLHDFSGPLPFKTPEGEFRLMLDSVVGRYTARQSVKKSIDARTHILEQGGIAAGRPPWGRTWAKAKKQFVIIPARRKQLQRAYEFIVNRRYSLNQAAKKLGLAASSLRKAIAQAALTKVTQRLQGKEYTFACPRLLDGIQHRRLLQRLSANVVVRPTAKAEYLLQGLVRCKECGAAMTGQTSLKSGSRYSVYRHPPATHNTGCTWGVPVDLLDENVLTGCAEVVSNGTALREAIEAALRAKRQDQPRLTVLRDELQAEIAASREKIDRLVDALSKLPKGEAQAQTLRRVRRLEGSLADQQAEFVQVSHQLAVWQTPSADADAIAAKLRSLYWGSGGVARTLPFEQRRAFVRAIVGRTGKDSPAGIFVRMIRRKGGTRKDVFWKYELLGLVANVNSYLDRQGEPTYPDIVGAKSTPSSAVKELAAVADSTIGVGELRVHTFKKSSSGA